jgi:ABC-type transport system involved in multi-copper enzyme maturation permease subunit
MIRTVLLIAANFAREQRWPILVLLLWVLLMSGLGLTVDVRTDREDLLVIFKQLAVYGIAFAIFVGGSAIHNERKTRRILAVLSKAVGRGEYVSGLLLGIGSVLLLYCFCMGLTGTWVLGQGGFSVSELWFLMFSLFITCLLAAVVAVTFSTFLNPLFATLASGLVLAVPAAITFQFGGAWGYLIPVYPLLGPFLKATFGTRWQADWTSIVLALTETAVLWLLAWRIFERRDVALAVD